MKHTRLLNLALAGILLAYAALGTFARYEADDYCQAVSVNEFGIVGFAQQQYQTWQGRYSSTLLMGAMHNIFGERAPAVLPVVLILGMVGAWVYLLRSIRRDYVLTLALALTLGFVSGVTNTWQTAYWMAAGVTYLPSIIGALLLGGWLMRRWHLALGSSLQVLMNSGHSSNS